MTQALHRQARTTHLIREEIRNSTLSQRELAERYNVSRLTIRKWQNRDSAEDRSHRPYTMHTTLTPTQVLRTTLLLPTDDLLAVSREFVNPALSRAALGRCLRRHGVSSLLKLAALESDKAVTRSRSRTTSPVFYTWTSSTCRSCLRRPNAATCSSPSTAPHAGSSWKSMPTRPAAATTF